MGNTHPLGRQMDSRGIADPMYQARTTALGHGVDTMGVMTQPDADASIDSVEPARWQRAAALFVRWREGDRRAMDELVRLMSPPLWHVVRAYGLDHALAQDVVQTTWLTLVRRHETIHDPQAVSGWLTMCARREAWRVGKQHRRADATEAESLEPHLPVHESAEQTASHDDENRRLGRVAAYETADWGRLEQIGPLLRLGPEPAAGPGLHLPGVGEHTVEVLREVGVADDVIDALLDAGLAVQQGN